MGIFRPGDSASLPFYERSTRQPEPVRSPGYRHPRRAHRGGEALSEALATAEDQQKLAVAAVAARWPRFLDAWARLGELADDAVESYGYYRIGYHRGLDKLRGSGWRGSGYVRWEHPTNQGFLRALIGLRAAAARIGEQDEVERIGEFLQQLDPGLEL